MKVLPPTDDWAASELPKELLTEASHVHGRLELQGKISSTLTGNLKLDEDITVRVT